MGHVLRKGMQERKPCNILRKTREPSPNDWRQSYGPDGRTNRLVSVLGSPQSPNPVPRRDKVV